MAACHVADTWLVNNNIQNFKVQLKISIVIVSLLLKSIFIPHLDSFLPKREVVILKTVFYKNETYIQDKTDS